MNCPFCHRTTDVVTSRSSTVERLVRELAERFDRLPQPTVEKIIATMAEADPALAMHVAELMLASRDLHELVTSIREVGMPN